MNKLLIFLFISLAILMTGCNQTINTATPQNTLETNVLSPVPPTQDPVLGPTQSQETQQTLPTSVGEAVIPTSTQLPQSTPIQCSGNLTSPNQEGPYYMSGSPERSSLVEAGMSGTPILIQGMVFDQNCSPIAGAKVDFWQADDSGQYDNVGYTLRGYVVTNENGEYSIETIEPGPYTGRPPHIHVKIFAPDGNERLTTQLYFPDSENSADVAASPDLLVHYLDPDETGRPQVQFNFVIQNP